MIERILGAVADLERFPKMGPVVSGVRRKGVELRVRLVQPYRVIYRIKYDRVVVLAVIHGARHLSKAMRGRPLG